VTRGVTCKEPGGSVILILELLGCLSRWKVMTEAERRDKVTMAPVDNCLSTNRLSGWREVSDHQMVLILFEIL
jgi:hypothetical protein